MPVNVLQTIKDRLLALITETSSIKNPWYNALKYLFGIANFVAAISIVCVNANYYEYYDVISSVKTTFAASEFYSQDQSGHSDENIIQQYNDVMQLWSDADYLTPSVENRTCYDAIEKYNQCAKGKILISKLGTVEGMMTGKCLKNDLEGDASEGVCEVYGWMPPEHEHSAPPEDEEPLVEGIDNLILFIKNTIHFANQPQTIYTTNFMQNEQTSLTELPNCTYDLELHPFCPVFSLGSIVTAAKQNYSILAVKGAAIRIYISWDCDLKDVLNCIPTYSFSRLDDNNPADFDNGWFNKKYKYSDENHRAIVKLYGIQCVVVVSGRGRSFDFIECIKSFGGIVSSLGISAIIVMAIVGYCFRKYENRKNTDEQRQSLIEDESRTEDQTVPNSGPPQSPAIQEAHSNLNRHRSDRKTNTMEQELRSATATPKNSPKTIAKNVQSRDVGDYIDDKFL